jgi:PRTRC genetic system protein E
MFQELFELAKTTTLMMSVSADAGAGTLTLNIVPKHKGPSDAPALATPLSLTATPEEFERDFPACLTGYTATRASLVEQAAAANAVIEAAKQAQVEKASKAQSKPPATKAPTPAKAAQAFVAASTAAQGEAGTEGDDDNDSLFD